MPELPAQDTHRPLQSDAPREVTVGQWLAMAGLLLGPAVMVYWLFTVDSFRSEPATWAGGAFGVAILGLLAYGIARRSRIAFVIAGLAALSQFMSWIQFSQTPGLTGSPLLLTMPVLTLLGLWLSRDQFWNHRE